jgi:hypothetical protein
MRLQVNARAATQATAPRAQSSGEFGRLHLEHRGELLADVRGVGAAVRQYDPRGALQRRRDGREQAGDVTLCYLFLSQSVVLTDN